MLVTVNTIPMPMLPPCYASCGHSIGWNAPLFRLKDTNGPFRANFRAALSQQQQTQTRVNNHAEKTHHN